jgi:hypothetical protein
MKRLTLRKNRCDEAMKRLTMLKNWSNEAFNASSPRFIASSLSTLYLSLQKLAKNGAKLSHTETLLLKLRKITNSWGNCHWDSLLHRFYALIFLFIKALRQWWQIREAMKRWNRYCGKKLKQWSNEAFNAGKEIGQRLTLHRIASSLHRFITSSAQLCSWASGLKRWIENQAGWWLLVVPETQAEIPWVGHVNQDTDPRIGIWNLI